MRWSRRAGLLALLTLLALPGLAAAQGPVKVGVLVSHISDGAGGVDPRGQKLHQKLQGEFRYQSLRVLDSRTLSLAVNELGTVGLPNGKQLKVRPVQLGDAGVLLAVDVEGAVKGDFRVRNGHLVVIGAERYQDGKLVVSLEPRW